MEKYPDWTDYDLSKISQIYGDLSDDKKLKNFPNAKQFLEKVIEMKSGRTEPLSSYVSRETHYALSDADFNFSEGNGFERITHEGYLRVRDKILEGHVYADMQAIRVGGKPYWASIMTGFKWMFGRTQEERTQKVLELVNCFQ